MTLAGQITEYLVPVLLYVGVFFYVAGSLGLLRFRDTESRLHALTKADNVGLGFVALAVALHAGSVAAAVKIAAVWLFALMAAGATAQLMARRAKAAAERGTDKGTDA
jgi:multicomponent Na+:H+ antiporter subunit G